MTIANGIEQALGAWNDRRPGRRTMRREDRSGLRWYAYGALFCVGLAWAAAGLYLLITPLKYAARWTLILPGAAQNLTMQLDTIGQATTTANSPFGTVSLSPKVVYKEIADSDQVRVAAAKSMGMTYAEFGRARIKLIDETGVMQFEIAGKTAGQAYEKAVALNTALNNQLDKLRQDELEKRSAATTLNLKSYKDAVDTVRRKIAETQSASGLVSINQFNELVGSVEAVRRRQTDLNAELSKLREEQARLIERNHLTSADASLALRLAGDAAFAKIVNDFADANAQYEAETRRLGPENPVLINADKRRTASLDLLTRRLQSLGLADADAGHTVVLTSNLSKHADLLEIMVRNEAQIDGKSKEAETLKSERARLEADTQRMSGAAARLEELRKESILAEAVYSSALARVDTNKSDIYGAYPIVQVLAAPTIPEGHEQPRRLYALAGGMAASLFFLSAWGLAWLHRLQMIKRRKKRSFIG